MRLYKGFLSILLLFLFSIPLGMNAVIVNKKTSILENSMENFPVPESILESTKTKLQASLDKFRYNGTVLISYKNRVIFEEAGGYANFKTKAPITLESQFQLASASKPFTALSIMILKERNLLEYDDKVKKYILNFPYPEISIRNLLNHTAGLQNYMYLVDNYWAADKTISNQNMLNLLIDHKLPLNNPPGSRFEYSNTGYAVLALVVEQITNQYFGDFLQIEIFDKIGMTNSFVYNRRILEQNPNQVIGYVPTRRGYRPYEHEPNNDILGDKSVYSTVFDLYRFEKALNNYELVKEETLREAYTKAILLNNRSVNYGFGWRMIDEEDRSYIFHNGLWHGFTSTITREPKEDISVIMLNNTHASINTIKHELLDILHTQFASYQK